MRRDDLSNAIPSFPAGRVVLAACRGDRVAYEDSRLGHGVFTANLIDGLMGEAADADGVVTVTSLYDYASAAVLRVGMQTPAFRGDFAGYGLCSDRVSLRGCKLRFSDVRAVELEREAQLTHPGISNEVRSILLRSGSVEGRGL